MIETGIDVRVKIQDIVTSQLPDFILSESPLTDDFLEQFYISQEFQGGAIDFASNLDQYKDLSSLTDTAVFGSFTLEESITADSDVVVVNTTKSFPNEWGLFKINDEIFTYTGLTTNTFTGVVRGFSGISSYRHADDNSQLIFESTEAAPHTAGSNVENLSTLFLKEFYKKTISQFAPGFEHVGVSTSLNAGNWIRNVRSFYQSKGSEESFKVLFKVLFGEEPTIIDLENFVIKPSNAAYARRDYAVARVVSGNPISLNGKTVSQNTSPVIRGAISEIDPFTRNGELYYRILFFVNQEETFNEQKLFAVPGFTKAQNSWSNGSYAVTVDSTIGFRDNGQFITSDGTVFNYEKRTVNQFLGVTCDNPDKVINIADEIIDNITVSGFDDDGNEIVLRLTGVISGIEDNPNLNLLDLGEKIFVSNLGNDIKNNDESLKQIIANSFVYNTSVRFEVDTYGAGSFTLLTQPLDKSSIKIGDLVDIVPRGQSEAILEDREVLIIDEANGIVDLADSAGLDPDLVVDLRRKQAYANSSNVPIEGGNNQILANITNVYDATEFNESFLVATNSLPNYEIDIELLQSNINNPEPANYEDYNPDLNQVQTLVFSTLVPFVTGDLITYIPGSETEPLVPPADYFVEVLVDRRKIRLYLSQSFISSDNYVGITSNLLPGEHNFVLRSQASREINPTSILKRVPISSTKPEAVPAQAEGSIGILANGLNINSYKSPERFYIGPLENVQVAAGGEGWNIVDPPEVTVSEGEVQLQYPVFTVDPEEDRAIINPVLKGKLDKILIDPQDFDIDQVFSITVTGGNSRGASAEPIISRETRTLFFDTRRRELGGGIDPNEELITFVVPHNLARGEGIRYNNRGEESIGIGSFKEANTGSNLVLANNGVYFAQPVNNTSIELYPTLDDLNAGVNTVGFVSDRTGFGIQSFETLSKNRIIGARIIDDGGEFFNRKLNFQPENVFIEYDQIRYENHGFSTGDIVVYETALPAGNIGGLSTSFEYFVEKIDEDTIQLANAGVGGTDRFDFDRKDFVRFTSPGIGTQIIRYEDIVANVNVSFGSSITGEVIATPFIRGEFESFYIDKPGVYGSDIINFQRNPLINITAGSDGDIRPIISFGQIVGVSIQNLGQNYSDQPIITVTDSSGSGTDAILRAVIENGRIEDVIIINPGKNYNELTTTVQIEDFGKNQVFIPSIRSLTVNVQERVGYQQLRDGQYSICSYDREIRENVFNDLPNSHSPIVGWANDGNPIYGGFGYIDPENNNSQIIALTPSYTLDANRVEFRPSQTAYGPGFFIEDYYYNDIGDLDEYNGRYCRTPEFPNGVYAYFAGISSDPQSISREPVFPYFIGPEFRDGSNLVDEEVEQDQFDFSGKPIYRNTFPYVIGNPFAGSEFLFQSYLQTNQDTDIIALNNGSIDRISVIGAGRSYAVKDIPIFEDNQDVVNSFVSKINGKEVISLENRILEYNPTQTKLIRLDKDTIRVYVDPAFAFIENDLIRISGVGTQASYLNSIEKILVKNRQMSLFAPLPAAPFGEITDIFVNNVADTVSVGSSLRIGFGATANEVTVLNVFPENKALRINRPIPYIFDQPKGTPVTVIPNFFEYKRSSEPFESEIDEDYYFNPNQTIAVGVETGLTQTLDFTIGNIVKKISVPTQRFYTPNTNFKTGELLEIQKETSANPLLLFDGIQNYAAPPVGLDTGVLYVGKVYQNYIGIRTSQTGPDVFFAGNGDNRGDYRIRTQRFAERPNVIRIESIITTEEPHGLQNNDNVTVTVLPEGDSGVGERTSVKVLFNEESQSLLVDPRDCQPSDVDLDTNLINIDEHKFVIGDYILYNSILGFSIGGLDENEKYFVLPFDSNNFSLVRTFEDLKPGQERPIDLNTTTGIGTQTFSLVNPRLDITKNNNVVFDISDPSLEDTKLNFYLDQQLTEIFENNGIDNDWVVSGVSTEGFEGASKTIRYSDNNPKAIYYGLEIGGYISTADVNANSNNLINFVDSLYNITQRVEVTGVNTFRYPIFEIPERNQYPGEFVSYITDSVSALGGIAEVQVISSGGNFVDLPEFISVDSVSGIGAALLPESNSIGTLSRTSVINPGWDYSADTTLTPEGLVQPIINYTDGDFVTTISVTKSANGYSTPPQAVLVDSVTRETIETGDIEIEIQSSSISDVNVVIPPTGLSRNVHELYAVNNSNTIPILRVLSSDNGSGIATFRLQTPILGYSTPPFEIGDKVFIENVFSLTNETTFLNSSDYGYEFFEVIDILANNPLDIAVQYPGQQVGVAATFQNGFSGIINQKLYPEFEVRQDTAILLEGERLSVFNNQNNLVPTDLVVTFSNKNYFKIIGNFDLTIGNRVRGNLSGIELRIVDIDTEFIRYEIDSTSRINDGWETSSGFLNDDFQALSDNDYYQNLSYSIRSSETFETIINSVNSLVHPAGLKNFSETSLETQTNIGVTTSDDAISITVDLIGLTDVAETPLRVDRSIFDLAFDADVTSDLSKSSSIRLQSRTANKRLTDFIEVATNRVLLHDDISDFFSDSENASEIAEPFTDFFIVNNQSFSRVLLQSRNPFTDKVQFTECVILFFDNNAYTMQKAIVTSEPDPTLSYGDLDGIALNSTEYLIRFTPGFNFVQTFDLDHKIYDRKFLGQNGIQGINIQFNQILGENYNLTAGETAQLFKGTLTDGTGVTLEIEIKDQNGRPNYYEIYAFRLNNDTFSGVYGFDAENFVSYSVDDFDNFTIDIDPVDDVIIVDFLNDSTQNIIVDTRTNQFSDTAVGIETYRFIADGLQPGQEESLFLTSKRVVGPGNAPTTLWTLDSDRIQAVRSVVYVKEQNDLFGGYYQVMSINSGDDTFQTVYPFITDGDGINPGPGIGTFGTEVSGTDFNLIFYPDTVPNPLATITFISYMEVFYRDFVPGQYQNIPLIYANNQENYFLERYNAPLGERTDNRTFPLTYQGIPIYSKTFNPTNPGAIFDSVVFNISNHFFSSGERLFYKPGTNVIDGPVSRIQVQVNGTGPVIDMPNVVYAIKRDLNRISLAQSFEDAANNIFLFVVDPGQGNAHTLTMSQRLEKTIITINGVTQAPISATGLIYEFDTTAIGFDTTFAVLAGIGTLQVGDILFSSGEYLTIDNVGFGENIGGPITNSGPFPLVEVQRGTLGGITTNHNVGAAASLYRGSYNIIESNVIFTDPPRGGGSIQIDNRNLVRFNSSFQGRTFLQRQYDQIILFDDISTKFDGVSDEYVITTGAGVSIPPPENGSGILLINDIYQTPTTDNNEGNNYFYISDDEPGGTGITSVIFTGIQSSNGERIISDFDVNQNQVPRGGLIVSLGSTPGLGYAPLFGARIEPIITGGSIVGLNTVDTIGVTTAVRWATYDNTTGFVTVTAIGDPAGAIGNVQNADYSNTNGLLTVETDLSLAFLSINEGDIVVLADLLFECSSGGAPSQQLFPDENDSFVVQTIIDGNTFTCNVGTSTIPHDYISGGTLQKFDPFEFGAIEKGNPEFIYLAGLGFTCPDGTNDGQSQFPQSPGGYPFRGNADAARWEILVGASTIPHTYFPTSGIGTIGQFSVLNSGSAYRGTVSVAVTDPNQTPGGTPAVITGLAGDGGELTFTINDGGTGYTETTKLSLPEPNYDNLPVTGVFRRTTGFGTETGINLFVTLEVGAANTTAIGRSEFFEVKNFEITNQGFAFLPGDIITAVGLVTAKGLTSPIEEFQLTVLETFTDNFAAWNFGELDYIDSIRQFQDGVRTRFPLIYQGEQFSFEVTESEDSQAVDLDSVLLIFVNTVLQVPRVDYIFEGGSSFEFLFPPQPQDRIDVYFYRGKRGVDSVIITDVDQTVRPGDQLQLVQNNTFVNSPNEAQARAGRTEDLRLVTEIASSNTVATPVYVANSDVTDRFPRQLAWEKQKRDVFIFGEPVFKFRDSIEPIIRPKQRFIRSFSATDTQMFLNNGEIFVYEENVPDTTPPVLTNIRTRNVQETTDLVQAELQALVNADGEISNINIINPGFGYTGAPDISFPNPVGLGTTTRARASATINVDGEIIGVNVDYAGTFGGYDQGNPPEILVGSPNVVYEDFQLVQTVQGFSGIITSIEAGPLPNTIIFGYLCPPNTPVAELQTGYSVVIFNTVVGDGVESLSNDGSILVGRGNEFLDCVYEVTNLAITARTGTLTVNVQNTDLSNIDIQGPKVGEFSWGRFANVERNLDNSIPFDVDGTTYTETMENYPSAIRITEGLRSEGGLGRVFPAPP